MKELLARLMTRPVIFIELIAASLFANLLALASSLYTIQVLNRYVTYGVDSTLATLTSGVLLAIVLEFGFRQVRLTMAAAISARPDNALTIGSFGILTGAKAAAMDMLPAGLRREVISGADTVQAAYNAPNIAAVLDVPFALVFVGALFLLSPAIAIVVICFLVGVLALGIGSQIMLRKPTGELTAVSTRRNTLIGSAIVAADTVRAFNAAEFVRRSWRGETGAYQELRGRVTNLQGLVQSLTQSAQAVMGVAVIAIGALQVVAGDLDTGAMIGCNIMAARALSPVIRLAQLGEAFVKASQSLSMFREFARLPQERTQGSALSAYRGGIEFVDVSFAYPGAKGPLFESLSLKLEPGSIMVVAGANGVGKTTLARLMLGLIEPTRGQFLVDGVDLAQIVPEWWRRQVSYLPQEPRLLNVSIKDNLRVFNPDLDEAGLNTLIDISGLRNFIDQSQEGLDTAIVNNGDTLSLGIRRRLALARSLACNGMLAVFDEPTEGLDKEGCAQVYAVMSELAKRGRTIVAFSHDPTILKSAGSTLDLNCKPAPLFTPANPKGKP